MASDPRRIPKLADVARAAKVGNATVSRALSGGKNVSSETMQRISVAVLELGYRPNRVAQTLKGGSSGIVGMIVPSLSDMFFAKCAEAVESVTTEHGALLVLVASQDADQKVLSSFQRLQLHHIDGLILARSELKDEALKEGLRHSPVPVVGIDRPLCDFGYSSLVCANFDGARMATKHLLEHGYSKIISVQVKPELYTMGERLRGYCYAMAEQEKEQFVETIRSRQDAVEMLKRYLIQGDLPVGIFAGNNLTARYLYEATHTLKVSIPHGVAILSFDDFDLADTLTPPISVVQQPIEELGRAAAKLLFEQIPDWGHRQQNQRPDPIELAPRLMLRGSCGCQGEGDVSH